MSYLITSEFELNKVAAPNLPLAPTEYEARYQEQLNNVLRLYFNRLDSLFGQFATSDNPGATSPAFAGYTTQNGQGITTTLTNTSTIFQRFTGTSLSTSTVQLPVTSTLELGWTFYIRNDSIVNVLVNSSGSNLVFTITAGTSAAIICSATGGTTATDWLAGLNNFSTYTGTGNVVLHALPTIRNPNITDGLLLNSLAGTAGQVMTSAGTSNVPVWTSPSGLKFVYGAFQDSTDQIASSTTTAYAVTFNTTDFSNGVSVASGSRLTVTTAGLYNLQFSIQLTNNTSSAQDVDIWFRVNGTNVNNSNSRFGLAPRKSAGDPYHIIAALNYFINLNATDYVEIMWRTTDVDVYIEQYAASSSPTRPAIPSAIATMSFVSAYP
jgi:hypothetical protein